MAAAAAGGKPSAAVTALFAVLAVAAVLLAPAQASILTVWSGPGCSGRSKVVSGCGCHIISGYHGGYHFAYTRGQTAYLHRSPHCGADAHPLLLFKDRRYCFPTGYRSVNIDC